MKRARCMIGVFVSLVFWAGVASAADRDEGLVDSPGALSAAQSKCTGRHKPGLARRECLESAGEARAFAFKLSVGRGRKGANTANLDEICTRLAGRSDAVCQERGGLVHSGGEAAFARCEGFAWYHEALCLGGRRER